MTALVLMLLIQYVVCSMLRVRVSFSVGVVVSGEGGGGQKCKVLISAISLSLLG